MSLLPQRKKSPVEIAKIREDLGIPRPPPAEAPTPLPHPSGPFTETFRQNSAAPAIPLSDPALLTPLPVPPPYGTKQRHLLKRAETIPSLPLDDQQPVEAITAVIAPPVLYLKPVHSLRKSEQVRLPVMPPVAPAANTNLPSQRHNNQDLQKIRRRKALALPPLIANPKLVAAHPALLIPGYLSVLIGAAAFCFYQQPIAVSAPCAGVSLLIATFIALKQPLSRHHAAFIAVITLFVIVFGALHYFPQLRHAT